MKERRRNARVGLLGQGHREFRTFWGALGPALHDRFLPSVKTNAFCAVRVHVPEKTVLPAAEAVPRHRHGDWYVNANHAHLYSPAKLARDVSIAGIASHSIPEFM